MVSCNNDLCESAIERKTCEAIVDAQKCLDLIFYPRDDTEDLMG